MWTTINVALICVTIIALCWKITWVVSNILRNKHNIEFRKVKYHEDTKLKIEEPVRPVPINDKVMQEIESIKTQLTGLNLNQGIKRR